MTHVADAEEGVCPAGDTDDTESQTVAVQRGLAVGPLPASRSTAREGRAAGLTVLRRTPFLH